MAENPLSIDAIGVWFVQLLAIAPAILLAVTVHEFAHGAVAYLFGDPTAKEKGRLSLNPLRHLDPVGTIFFILFRFGWGKPVPVDGSHFKSPRRDMAVVSLAGPASNFLLAAFFGSFIRFNLVNETIAVFLVFIVQINIILGVFNLLPIPPLDGSRLVSALLPGSLLEKYEAIEGYGIAIIFLAIFIFPGGLFSILGPFIGFFNRLFLI